MRSYGFYWRLGLIILAFLFLGFYNQAFAANDYQTCFTDNNCVIGEFLYSDSYVPIATAECQLTSRYPDGELYINSATMSASVDGWYSYEFIASDSAGLYRSQICCSDGTDYLCLDKSFAVEASSSALTKADVSAAVWDEARADHQLSGSFGEALQQIVPSTSEITASIWGYSSRTLTNFGTLPSLIWDYSSRSLSSVSSLVSSIWSHSDRTVTNSSSSVDTTDLAKKADVDNLKSEVLYNQSLLEKLANKPIIKNYLEEEPDLDLESKLNQTQSNLTKAFVDSYAMDSKLGMLDVKWEELDAQQLQTAITDIAKLNSGLVKNMASIKNKWDLPLAETLYIQAQAMASRVAIIKGELAVEDKSLLVLTEIKNLSQSLNSFIEALGSVNDKPDKGTLFAQFKAIQKQADVLDLYAENTDKLLNNWRKLPMKTIQTRTNKIADNLAKINRLPNAIAVVSSGAQDSLQKKLKNRLLSIKATIFANKLLLAKKTSKPFSNSWLEEGSVIFKTLLSNPSTRISQEVPLKYYLPSEINKENIIDKDEGLKIKYDVDKKQLYVEGEFTLAPSESKIVAVRVEDIWLINQQSLESLRRQAEELTKPLEKTVYFGQGVTIKSNINVILDKIIASQESAITPEAKIKSYYEAQIELKSVKEQIARLEDLVTQAGSFSSMAGFVGGSQTIAVWGLMIVIVAGFVFLVAYMRHIKNREKPQNYQTYTPLSKRLLKTISSEGLSFGKREVAYFTIAFLTMNILTSTVVSLSAQKIAKPEQTALLEPAEVPAQPKVSAKQNSLSQSSPVLGMVMRKSAKVTIKKTNTNLVQITSSPLGTVVDTAQPGEQFGFVQEKNGWVELKMKDGTHGFVDADLVSIEN